MDQKCALQNTKKVTNIMLQHFKYGGTIWCSLIYSFPSFNV